MEAAAIRSTTLDNCSVCVALDQTGVAGYASDGVERRNQFGQIHGFAVLPSQQRRGVACALVDAVESFVRRQGARGVRVDTPVDNVRGRRFYEAAGFAQDYIMTRYYGHDLHGVTYVRFY